ncbi:MAG: YgiT-type zinc finger protein, partial [Terriglobia bacterium]
PSKVGVSDTKEERNTVKPYDDCRYCGGEVEERLERLDYRYHGQLFLVENVTVGVCKQCGEKFLTAQVAKQIEAAVSSVKEPVATVAIPVVRVPG